MNGDLTTLARYKEYINTSGTNMDALLGHLITRASGQIARYCSRSFYRQLIVNALMNGTGTDRLFLPQFPIISVSALSILGISYTYSANPYASSSVSISGSGGLYTYDQRQVYLMGGCKFPYIRQAVTISYIGGFNASETGVIPSSGTIALTPTTSGSDDGAGFPMVDFGVTAVATGVPMTSVSGAPAVGQYSFSGGTYTFNSGDGGKSVTMNYDYIPGGVEQACVELVALKVKQRDNIGVQSRGLAGETITYMDKDMTKSVQGLLNVFNSRVPM